ncbi:MAG: hypothetical protein CM15mP12_2660 [Gammaproteobacteria bacterium]|nr:MAG: hypothetical protein CM15mP12_2660 [Gammaproteobacteria bacterium]
MMVWEKGYQEIKQKKQKNGVCRKLHQKGDLRGKEKVKGGVQVFVML